MTDLPFSKRMSDVAALVALAKTGDAAKVRDLLAAQPDLGRLRLANGETPLMAAVYGGHRDVADALINGGAEVDVFAAAATGRLDELRRTLTPETAGAYSYDGWTALHLAAFFGRLDAVQVLLDGSADVRAVSRNSLANTPLHAATAGKHAGVALALLSRGADPGAIDAGGYTPLRIAQENQLSAVVAAISSTPS